MFAFSNFIQIIYLPYNWSLFIYRCANGLSHTIRLLPLVAMHSLDNEGEFLSCLNFHVDLSRLKTREKEKYPNDRADSGDLRRLKASITTVRCAWQRIWRSYYNNCFGNCCRRRWGPTRRVAFPVPSSRSRVTQYIIAMWSTTSPHTYMIVYRS